ncbi:hypothetical protein E4P34_02420 [Kocuria rhizophila]|uniref:DUF3800 domain-containing protein n=1 Tax=Kocuria rhizophila TaxID=72000 RepID=A0AAX2SE47_KOCRH|nr:hypothetical protein [Kocuria rhizophila]TFI01301.1 hypothetical protein E4P33_06980 [Kocuria rhizophila]TFI09786.1 hypothetical protein E4P34_02420 [Kocuria rhizophila]
MARYELHSHVFVDESKVGGYYVVASAVATGDVNRVRKAVRSLALPGQKRIHFTDERDDRRKKLLKEFSALDLVANVYVARGLRDKEARPLCLVALARDVAASGADHLCVEKDESSYAHDKKIIGQALQSSESGPRYDFPRAQKSHCSGCPTPWRGAIRSVATGRGWPLRWWLTWWS